MMQQTIARYRDRAAAGAVLAEQLMKYAGQNVAVFGVGAGGVAVAAPIARALGADLDVLAVRRLTLPGQPDQPWGAVAVLGDCVQVVAEPDTHRRTAAEPGDTVRQRDLTELRQLEDTYRAGRPPERITGRLVIVVGDGLTSLAAMRAAASAVRRHRPAQLVIAIPTGNHPDEPGTGPGRRRGDLPDVRWTVSVRRVGVQRSRRHQCRRRQAPAVHLMPGSGCRRPFGSVPFGLEVKSVEHPGGHRAAVLLTGGRN